MALVRTLAFVALAALTTPALRPARDISYGVYLAHGPVIQLAILAGIYRGDGVGLGAVLAVVLALAFVAERLAPYKAPRYLVIVDELPRGPTGKPVGLDALVAGPSAVSS